VSAAEVVKPKLGRLASIVVGLLSLAVMGFLAADFNGRADTALLIIGLLVFVVVVVLAGNCAGRRWATLAGGGIATLALLVVLYANYAAYALHWQGLQTSDLGSDDYPGHSYVVLGLIVGILPVATVGAVVGVLGYLIGSRWNNQ
jgi:hypothetical protein